MTPPPESERTALHALLLAIYAISGDPEDCDDCGDIEERPCRLHGSASFFASVLAAEAAMGPCERCGHTRGQHHDEDSTACRECRCPAFRLGPPRAEETPAPEPELPTQACWNCRGRGVFNDGLGIDDAIVWVPPYPCPVCNRSGLASPPAKADADRLPDAVLKKAYRAYLDAKLPWRVPDALDEVQVDSGTSIEEFERQIRAAVEAQGLYFDAMLAQASRHFAGPRRPALVLTPDDIAALIDDDNRALGEASASPQAPTAKVEPFQCRACADWREQIRKFLPELASNPNIGIGPCPHVIVSIAPAPVEAPATEAAPKCGVEHATWRSGAKAEADLAALRQQLAEVRDVLGDLSRTFTDRIDDAYQRAVVALQPSPEPQL